MVAHRAATAQQLLRFTLDGATDSLLFPFSPYSIFLHRSSLYSSSLTFHHHHSFFGIHSKTSHLWGVCYATNPGSPLPESDPPPEKHSTTTSDIGATFSKVQDRMQIFFAVLFWMSLFFWKCAWDGRDDDDPTKKSRFRG
ncbi:Sodium channel protein type 10 subunit alpha like [Thalictrum thalictroides]|uniref:Sodium channel protein type 10 subunit alpha like n=1 Tax=Thalictrum thalictroides TaxID=46969 RepID=A0A7J6W0N5_THATH|nr:Sodium channel protein type 10 subunit alpha like [Thalictrum thalictroides]